MPNIRQKFPPFAVMPFSGSLMVSLLAFLPLLWWDKNHMPSNRTANNKQLNIYIFNTGTMAQ